MLLSKNFKLAEFAVSKDRPDLARQINFSESDIVKYYYLVQLILQPIRDLYGTTIITSGKRTHELNQAIKGATYSDHLCGLNPAREFSVAADFTLQSDKLEDAYNWAIKNRLYCIGQLIYYKSRNFIHVSLRNEAYQSQYWINEETN